MLASLLVAGLAVSAPQVRVTHVSTATLLIEVGSYRIVTDPTLDGAGGRYGFGFGTHSTKTEAPALDAAAVRGDGVDLVLLSHDRHADNLDSAGRRLLAGAQTVLTTKPGARRLRGGAVGLRPWQSHTVVTDEGVRIEITATPARHGPPLSLGIVGRVVGFVLRWEGQQRGAVYISGDTVDHRRLAKVARRFDIGTAFLHVGGVRFPRLAGRTLFTMDGEQAADVARRFEHAVIIPVHYDGWTHFKDPVRALRRSLAAPDLAARTQWLPKGKAIALKT